MPTKATNDSNDNKIVDTYALRGTGVTTTSELSKYISINKHYNDSESTNSEHPL